MLFLSPLSLPTTTGAQSNLVVAYLYVLDVVVTCSGSVFALGDGLINHGLGFTLAVEKRCAGGLGLVERVKTVVGVGRNELRCYCLA